MIEKVQCGKCAYENEPQRIFCHECGEKLDRTEYLREQEALKAAREKAGPKKLDFGKSNKLSIIPIKPLILVLIASFIVAMFVQMGSPVDPPEEIPQAVSDSAYLYMDRLDQAFFSPSPTKVSLPAGVVSNEVLSRVKESKSTDFWGGSFKKAWVTLQEGRFNVVTERHFFDFPFYFSGSFAMEKDGDTLQLKTVGGRIGRFPVPGVLIDPLKAVLFKETADGVKAKKKLEKIKNIEIKEKEVIITAGGE